MMRPSVAETAALRAGDVWIRLQRDVIDSGLCTHCGDCAGLSNGALRMQTTDQGPLPVPTADEPCCSHRRL